MFNNLFQKSEYQIYKAMNLTILMLDLVYKKQNILFETI
jgi:hypothetical protein